jgi:hypothetical protein
VISAGVPRVDMDSTGDAWALCGDVRNEYKRWRLAPPKPWRNGNLPRCKAENSKKLSFGAADVGDIRHAIGWLLSYTKVHTCEEQDKPAN